MSTEPFFPLFILVLILTDDFFVLPVFFFDVFFTVYQ